MNQRMIVIAALIVVMLWPLAPILAQEAELVVWIRDDEPFDVEAIGQSFAREHGVRLVVTAFPWPDLRDKFAAEAASGDGPDILVCSDDWGYIEAGLIAPIDLGAARSDYVPYAVDAFSRAGQLYAVPYALENLALVRNTDLVPEAPATWDQVMDISAGIRDSGAATYGFVLQDYDAYHFSPIQSAYGGYIFGTHQDGTFNAGDVGLNNPGSVAALEWLKRMAESGLLPPGMDWETAHAAFESGNAAMIITGPWAIGRFADSGVPFAVSALPVGTVPSRPFVHITGFAINAHTPNPDLAQLFLREVLASEPGMRAIYQSVHRVPAQMAVFEQMDDPVLLGFASAALNGQRVPDIPEMGAVWDPWANAIQQVREGRQDPQAALDEAVAQIRATIGG
jgi:maltose/maltodextrin transport system substrate-binding protein/arabinogalactan oligomer/maltooligosaccharide transport system substrate-binding protein